MDSNSIRSNPLFQRKKVPRLGVEEFAVGSESDRIPDDLIPKPTHRTKHERQKHDIANISRHTLLQHAQNYNFEMNANLNRFADVQSSERSAFTTNMKIPHRRSFYNPPLSVNNSVQEAHKPRVIKEHVGASHNEYPTTKIDRELLNQRGIQNISQLDEMMKQLSNGVEALKSASTRPESETETPIKQEEETAITQNTDQGEDRAVSKPIDEYSDAVAEPAERGESEMDDTEKAKARDAIQQLDRLASRLQRRNSDKTDLPRAVEQLKRFGIPVSEAEAADRGAILGKIELIKSQLQSLTAHV